MSSTNIAQLNKMVTRAKNRKNSFLKTFEPLTQIHIHFTYFPVCPLVKLHRLNKMATRPQGYKTFFMLISTEHEIYPVHKC